MLGLFRRKVFGHVRTLRSQCTSRMVEIEGIKYRVHIRNGELDSANEVVFCMPGALGTAANDFPSQLNGGLDPFTVVSFDPRGYGTDRNVDRDFPLDFYERDADDAVSIMQALSLNDMNRKINIVGWSDGANSACILAGKYPHLVRSLSIFGGNAYITEEDIELWEKTRDIANWSERMRSSLGDVYGLKTLQEMWHGFCDAMLELHRKKGGDICLRWLHKISCPTLVLHGSKDPMITSVHPDYFMKHIPSARLYEFPDGKHNIHIKYKDEFNAVLKAFITDLLTSCSKNTADEANINNIAYGFMGSKALFQALHLEIFDAIDNMNVSGTPVTVHNIAEYCKCEVLPLQTLLNSLTALNLIHVAHDGSSATYSNSKSVAMEMVQSSKYYWGDYLKQQIDLQFYPRMSHLDAVFRPTNHHTSCTSAEVDAYDAWFQRDPEAASLYTTAQHNGSLATAKSLIRRLPEIFHKKTPVCLLDIGGGSGAFPIMLCSMPQHAASTATVLDLPAVTDTAKQILVDSDAAAADQELLRRIVLLAGSATDEDWQLNRAEHVSAGGYDIALMSYVSGSLPHDTLKGVYTRAFNALKPGGKLIIHDFMVDNSLRGPVNAALWALAHTTVNPTGIGLSPGVIIELTCGENGVGFTAPMAHAMIPGMTKIVVLTKPIV